MITLHRTIRSAVVAAMIVTGLAGCSHGHPGDAVDPNLPHIDRVRPDSVIVPRDNVVEVTIFGRRFAPGTPGKNTIQFAGTSITQVPANDRGTELKFIVPDAIPSGSGAAPLHLETGTYTLRITTAAGTSNPVSIRIFR